MTTTISTTNASRAAARRLGWAILACAVSAATAAALTWHWAQRVALPAGSNVSEDLLAAHALKHAPKPLRDGVQAEFACRSGAYMQASAILGSLLEVSRQLPADTPERARQELDGILYVAMKQARAEVHCVAGTLPRGYDRALAETMQHSVALARSRGLSQDVQNLGLDTEQALRANKAMCRPEDATVAAAQASTQTLVLTQAPAR